MASVHGKKIRIEEEFDSYNNIKKKVLSLPESVLNPFDESYFASLVGSAQLEGSTVTLGETVDLILKEIYPDKSHKAKGLPHISLLLLLPPRI